MLKVGLHGKLVFYIQSVTGGPVHLNQSAVHSISSIKIYKYIWSDETPKRYFNINLFTLML